ncbi:MAG TPA: PcfJ domain-containing protein, partial [Bacteroidales bacterium]|nr:PcfJ domain-containing protein [Bacteroidales bacterium]
FKKQNSLLLQALIDNNPVETVEFSLLSLKVVQCQGKFNKTTKFHSEIINLINDNILAIAQRI